MAVRNRIVAGKELDMHAIDERWSWMTKRFFSIRFRCPQNLLFQEEKLKRWHGGEITRTSASSKSANRACRRKVNKLNREVHKLFRIVCFSNLYLIVRILVENSELQNLFFVFGFQSYWASNFARWGEWFECDVPEAQQFLFKYQTELNFRFVWLKQERVDS